VTADYHIYILEVEAALEGLADWVRKHPTPSERVTLVVDNSAAACALRSGFSNNRVANRLMQTSANRVRNVPPTMASKLSHLMLRCFRHRTCSFICLVNFRRIFARGRNEITSAKGTCVWLASRRGAALGVRGRGHDANRKATKHPSECERKAFGMRRGCNSRSLAKSKSNLQPTGVRKTQRKDRRSSCPTCGGSRTSCSSSARKTRVTAAPETVRTIGRGQGVAACRMRPSRSVGSASTDA
jgi:hypothetical protein